MLLALTLLLMGQVVPAPDEGCVHNPEDGSVRCDGASFKQLIDKVLDARLERDTCQLRKLSCESRLTAVEQTLLTQPKPAPVVVKPVKPVVALMTAIVGTAAISTALLHEKMDTAPRIGLGVAGTLAITTSFIIVF